VALNWYSNKSKASVVRSYSVGLSEITQLQCHHGNKNDTDDLQMMTFVSRPPLGSECSARMLSTGDQEVGQGGAQCAFFDPKGYSVGFRFDRQNPINPGDLLRCITLLRLGRDSKETGGTVGDAVCLARGETIVWEHHSVKPDNWLVGLVMAPGHFYMTNLRLILEVPQSRGALQQAFPESVQSIRWGFKKGPSDRPPELGAAAFELSGPPLFDFERYLLQQNAARGGLAITGDLRTRLMQVPCVAWDVPVTEMGAKFVAVRQGWEILDHQESGVPFRLAVAEVLRYSKKLSPKIGSELEVWLTDLRLIVRFRGGSEWRQCDVIVGPSFQVSSLPWDTSEIALVFGFGESDLLAAKVRLLTSIPKFKRFYIGDVDGGRKRFSVDEQKYPALVGCAGQGPLIIPMPPEHATLLLNEMSSIIGRRAVGNVQTRR
jgi:hypothetical protein